MDPIKQIVTDFRPDVLTITEAQLRPETPIQLVNIPGYKLHTDSLYTYGLSARTVTYTIDRQATKEMNEYLYPDISVVPLQIIRGSKKFQILSFYRQWSKSQLGRREDSRQAHNLSPIDSSKYARYGMQWLTLRLKQYPCQTQTSAMHY